MVTRKAIVPASQDEVQSPGEALDNDLEDDSPEFAIDRVLTAFGSVGAGEKAPSIKLYGEVKVDPHAPSHVQQSQLKNVGKMQWLRDYTPEELDGSDLELVRTQFGPGKYEFRVYGYRPGSTRYVVLARPEVLIGALPGQYDTRAQQPPVAPPNNELALVVQQLADGQRQLLEAISHRPDPMANMKEMFGMMALMREAMGTNQSPAPAPQKSSIAELIDGLRELRGAQELFGGEAPKSEVDKLLELAQPVIQMASQAFARPATPSHDVQQLAAHQVPQLQMPASISDATAPQEQTAAPNPSDAVQQVPSENEVIAQMRAHLDHLIALAASKDLLSIPKGAEYVYEKLPDDFLELLGNEMWWSALSGFEPKTIPHEAWFAAVRKETLSMLAEDAQEDAAAGAVPAQSK